MGLPSLLHFDFPLLVHALSHKVIAFHFYSTFERAEQFTILIL